MRRLWRLAAVWLTLAATALAAQGPLQSAAAPGAAKGATSAPGPAATVPALSSRLTAADAEAWLDGFLPYAMARGQIPGAVVVIVSRDGVLLQKGFGYADLKTRKPVSPDATLFRPGSVSKLITWTAVMQQVEAGKLDLDKDVNTYLDFKIPPLEGKPITLRNIMTHSAGFEESIRYLISSDPKAAMQLGRLVKVAVPARVFAPGTTPAYSNYATALAGYIVERVSGIPFEDYVEQRIFAPLGMTHSSFRQPLQPALQPLMSSGYASLEAPAKPFEFVLPGPAGALSSSGADMGKFMVAHLNNGGTILKPETTRLMHDSHAPGIGPLNTMALGFYEQWVNGRRAIAHGGDTSLFHSYLWLFPDDGIGVYVSLNSGGKEGAAQAVRSALFHGFADRYLPPTSPPVTASIDDATARKHAEMLAGHYVSSRGAFTNFMSLLGLFGQAKIVVGPDGKLQFPSLAGLSAGTLDWVEVAPFVWRDTATGERLAAEVEDGRVIRVSTDAMSPFTVFLPASVGENTAWLLPALVAALTLVLLAAVFWPIRALVRRHFKAGFPLTGRPLLAWRLSRIFAVLVVIAVAGWILLVVTFSKDIGSVGGPLDWLIVSLRVLTPLATFGLLVTAAWHLALSWRDRRSWWMRLGALLLVLAALVLCWVTVKFHLYGFSMVY
jgi:CubicO group peptidase (beta-lactamase class C family)